MITIMKFSADWCPGCKLLAPEWKEAKSKHKEVEFMEVDVDKHPNIASEHDVRSIPTILIFKDGNLVDGLVGDKCKNFSKRL